MRRCLSMFYNNILFTLPNSCSRYKLLMTSIHYGGLQLYYNKNMNFETQIASIHNFLLSIENHSKWSNDDEDIQKLKLEETNINKCGTIFRVFMRNRLFRTTKRFWTELWFVFTSILVFYLSKQLLTHAPHIVVVIDPKSQLFLKQTPENVMFAVSSLIEILNAHWLNWTNNSLTLRINFSLHLQLLDISYKSIFNYQIWNYR